MGVRGQRAGGQRSVGWGSEVRGLGVRGQRAVDMTASLF